LGYFFFAPDVYKRVWLNFHLNVHPRTGHEMPHEDYRYSSTLSLTSAYTDYANPADDLSSNLSAIINSACMDFSSVSCLLYVQFMSF